MESKFPEYISQGQRPFRDKWKFTGIFQLINLVNCFVQDICASVSAFESDSLLLGRWFHVASFCPFYILFVIESGCETQRGGETISATGSNVRHPHEHHSSVFLNLVYSFQFVRYSVPCFSLWQVFSHHASGVRLQLNEKHWKMTCDSQPSVVLLLCLVFCCSVPFSFSCQSGMARNGLLSDTGWHIILSVGGKGGSR